MPNVSLCWESISTGIPRVKAASLVLVWPRYTMPAVGYPTSCGSCSESLLDGVLDSDPELEHPGANDGWGQPHGAIACYVWFGSVLSQRGSAFSAQTHSEETKQAIFFKNPGIHSSPVYSPNTSENPCLPLVPTLPGPWLVSHLNAPMTMCMWEPQWMPTFLSTPLGLCPFLPVTSPSSCPFLLFSRAQTLSKQLFWGLVITLWVSVKFPCLPLSESHVFWHLHWLIRLYCSQPLVTVSFCDV